MKIGIGYTIPNAKGGHSAPNPGFEYDPIAWCEDDGPNTPTVTGDPGGVFSVSPSITGFNTTTGAIPANTAAGSYAVTYAVNGVSETDTITISPDVSTTFTYPNAENRFTIFPTQATTTAGVYSFTVNPGNITFANGATTSTTGSIDTTGAALGAYTVQFQPDSTCGNPTTSSFNIIQAFESFEFTVQMAQGETFTIPTTGSGYSYRVNWGLNSNNNLTNFVGQGNLPAGNNYTGNATSPSYNAGTYTIQIGDYNGSTFPRIYFNNGGDKAKVRNITSWGEIPWTSFNSAFRGCVDLGITATNSPDLSNCTAFNSAFADTTNFVGDSSMNNWDTSTITNMYQTFYQSGFNTDISNWNTSSVTSMSQMFRRAYSFNQPINTNYLSDAQSPTGSAYTAWDVSSNANFSYFLSQATSFNQDIGNFKLKSSGTIDMQLMFYACSNFNQDINTKSVTVGPNTYAAWDTARVTNFNQMFFQNTNFNSSVSKWNTSNVTNTGYMFYSANKFNQDINTKYYDAASSPTGSAYTAWDMSNVTNVGLMLYGASKFNQSIDKWQFNTSVTSFSQFMRGCADFNQPINTQTVTVGPNTYTAWDVQNITSFGFMFYGCADFNQPLNNWNTGSVTNMGNMFFQCSSFDQSLATWDISSVSSFGTQFGYLLNLSTANYDATLISWNNQNVQTLTQNVDFGESVPSCDNTASNGAFAARANLMTSNKWNVSIVDRFSTHNRCQPLAGFDYTSNAYCTNGSPSTVDPTIIGTPDSFSYITESYSVAQTFSGLNGQANTGGGGGGGASKLSSSSSISANGGSGGSGIVTLKYPTNLNATFSAGLTKTNVVSGSDTITSITAGSGTVTFANAGTLSEYLIVAGGGGGGGSQWYSGFWQSSGAGGGAGGLLTATNLSVSAQSYNITVGAGGAGGLGVVDNSGTTRNCGETGTSGQNSIFSSFTAIGGGGGGGGTHNGNSGTYACSNGDGLNGGSGGGAGGIVSGNSAARTAGTGTAGQGNNGGGPGSGRSANGGGGAGAAGSGGAVNSSPGGDGGIGVISSITGTATYYAGGGGGGGYWQNAVGNGTGGNGGTGGGGAGGTSKP